MADIERKLASIKRITEINPIPDADAIECAIVGGGWPVVVKKGEFDAGDLSLYIELDSWTPHELAPFLSKGKEPREYNGVKGERLRTVKLRGQVSQGLLLPITETLRKEFSHTFLAFEEARELQEGDDLTEMLGIQKWEAPIPACLAGQVRGNFPSWISKTDQERCLFHDTLIETSAGEMTIKELCENKPNVLVKSYNTLSGQVEMREVTDFSTMDETNEDWFLLTTKGGKRLTVTGNHLIWCEDLKDYKMVKDIKPGQRVLVD